jgi:hypothetical protein
MVDMNGWKLTSSWDTALNNYPTMGFYGLTALFRTIPYWSHTVAGLFYDSEGQPLDGAYRYTLAFDVKNLPLVTDF